MIAGSDRESALLSLHSGSTTSRQWPGMANCRAQRQSRRFSVMAGGFAVSLLVAADEVIE
jgi:hypothetical protein